MQSVAMKVVKAYASAQEFNDLNWNTAQVSYLNGAPYLLRIRSKTDSTKVLLYSEKNNIIHMRWAQFKINTNKSEGVLTVSSLNETIRKESSYKNGRISSSRTFVNNVLSTSSDNIKELGGQASNNLSMHSVKGFGPRTLEDAPDPPVVDPGDGSGDDGKCL